MSKSASSARYFDTYIRSLLESGEYRYIKRSTTTTTMFLLQKCGGGVFLKVACVAEAILRKLALKFSLCIENFSFNP